MAVQLKHTVAKVKNKDGAWEGIPALKGESVYDIAVRNGYVGTEDELVEQMLSDGWVTSCIKLENEKANITDVYNKTQVLSETTKNLYGLNDVALPDDILASLSKVTSHAWLRTSAKKQYDLKISNESSIVTIVNGLGDDTQVEVYYGESISVDVNGKVSIPNPITGYVCYMGYAYGKSNPVLKDKYFTLDNQVFYKATASLNKFRERDISRGNYDYYVTVQARVVYSEEIDDGNTGHVFSHDQNAYPENGELGGFKYNYLGTALINAISSLHCKVGSYIGTGYYGPDNPNKLTFDFVPKIVVVINESGSIKFVYAGQTGDENSISYAHNTFSVTDKTLSWYNKQVGNGGGGENSASGQCNVAGRRYFYFGLG